MASLSAHLREPGDHGRLGFHPECPACRDSRLQGALPADEIVSRRAQALVAAGVLAFSAVAPASVLAQGSEQGTVGTADPAASSSDPADDPDFHPVGEDQSDDEDADAADDPNAGEFDPDGGSAPVATNVAP